MNDYFKLKVNDVFKIEGSGKTYVVKNRDSSSGGGCGMGEYPAEVNLLVFCQDDNEFYTINSDNWSNNKNYQVVGTTTGTTKIKQLKVTK